MKRILPIIVGIILFLIFPANFVFPKKVLAATPAVTSLTPSTTTVGQYQKFEAAFQIDKTSWANPFLPYYYYDPSDSPSADPGRNAPYGTDGISIDAHFRSPSCNQVACEKVVPAFYYQDYFATGQYSWKIRFAPEEIGNYSYYLTIQDKEGVSRYPTSGSLTFNSVSSNSKGFIRVSQADPRFMAFDNGESFIPIGSGHQWWKFGTGRSNDYLNIFPIWGQNGINFTRIWIQNDGYSLTIEGNFDAYSWPNDYNPVDRGVSPSSVAKGTQINQRGTKELDNIVSSAEQNGVYLQLTSHQDPYWIWPYDIYGQLGTTQVSWTDTRRLAQWKRNFRYLVARYGYSTSVMAWEHWNELGHVSANSPTWNFYANYLSYQKTADPYRHLLTTSQGSQAYSPAFWSQLPFDIANYHDYMMISRYPATLTNDEVNFVSKFAWCLTRTSGASCSGLAGDGSQWSGAYKPWVWGEMDVGTSVWNVTNPKTKSGGARVRMLHNTTWAGLFSPMGVSPLDWYWDQEDAATTTQRYTDRKGTAEFFKGVDYAGGVFTYLLSSNIAPSGYNGELLTVSNPAIRAFAMRRYDKKAAYIWLVHQDSTWDKYPNNPPIDTTVTINNLNPETYRIQVWNTKTGTVVSTNTIAGPTINIPANYLSGLTEDAAIKIESTTGLPTSAPQPTPTTILPTNPSITPNPTVTINPPTQTQTPQVSPTIAIGNGDADGDGQINVNDVTFAIKNWGSIGGTADQYRDNYVNSMDFTRVLSKYLAIPTPTPVLPTATIIPSATPAINPTATITPTPIITTPLPTYPPAPNTGTDWTQDAHDAQRTGYTNIEPNEPWTYQWFWPSPVRNTFSSIPREGRAITGGGNIYVPAGPSGLYALKMTDGTSAWPAIDHLTVSTFNAAVAYDSGFVYAGGANGNLYKINAANGSVAGTFSAGSPLNKAVLLANGFAYVGTDGGTFYKVATSTMTKSWEYSAGSKIDTPAAYSTNGGGVLVFATADLNIHAVNDSNGSQRWKKKPSPNAPGGFLTSSGWNSFAWGWPVVAEQHGVVLLRQQLIDVNDTGAKTAGPNAGKFYSTNAENRTWLDQNPQYKNLFVLNLNSGNQAFTPAVGFGSVEERIGGQAVAEMGTQPVVKVWPNGNEVAYIPFRINQSPCGTDYRWGGHMGEMVLDNTTINGLVSGDLRFVKMNRDCSQGGQSYVFVIDEEVPITLAGNSIFNAHWGASESVTITDRSPSLGITYGSPIATINHKTVIRSQNGCGDAATHIANCGLTLFQDGRYWDGPGFYVYNGQVDPPRSPVTGSYSVGFLPRYTFVSEQYVIVQGNGGDLFVLKHN